MQGISFETNILTDRSNNSLRLDLQCVFWHRYRMVSTRPSPFIEGVMAEDSFIQVNYLELIEPCKTQLSMHLPEDIKVDRVSEVNEFLLLLNILVADAKLFIGAIDESGGDLELREVTMEHNSSLLEREVSP